MSTPIHFCTYFDHRYLVRALCLYDSLCEHSPPFVLHVLSLSEHCEQILRHLNLPFIQVTSLTDLENAKTELLEAKRNRSIVEYYFTLTSAFCQYLMDTVPTGTLLTYLDSDLYFFASPAPVLKELEGSAVGIIEHRFSKPNRERVTYGRFNVGWVSFRNEERGHRCLDDWYAQCLNWCYDRLEDERYADQKYLDKWPDQFPGVTTIQHHGANVGPWNIEDFHLKPGTSQGKSPIALDGSPLIFAHFQSVRRLGLRTFQTGFDLYAVAPSCRKQVSRQIYKPYLRHLLDKEKSLAKTESIKALLHEPELRHAKTMRNQLGLLSLARLPIDYLQMTRRYNWIRV